TSVATQLPRATRDDPATMMALHSRVDPNNRAQFTSNAGTPTATLPGQKAVAAINSIPWDATNTKHRGQEKLIVDANARPMAGPVTQAEARGVQVSGAAEVKWRTENT